MPRTHRREYLNTTRRFTTVIDNNLGRIVLGLLMALALYVSFNVGHANAAVPHADLSVRIASSDLTVDEGQSVLGRAEFKNNGPDDATNASITVHFDTYTFDGFCTSHTVIVGGHAVNVCDPSGVPANCTLGATSFTCTAATYADGSKVIYSFNATAGVAPGGTRPRFSGDVTSLTADPVSSNNHALAQSTLP